MLNAAVDFSFILRVPDIFFSIFTPRLLKLSLNFESIFNQENTWLNKLMQSKTISHEIKHYIYIHIVNVFFYRIEFLVRHINLVFNIQEYKTVQHNKFKSSHVGYFIWK